jgi:hypothetical protein
MMHDHERCCLWESRIRFTRCIRNGNRPSLRPSWIGALPRRIGTLCRSANFAPVLAVGVLAALAVFLWFRIASPPAPALPATSNLVTHLDATGFQALPNGEARVISVKDLKIMIRTLLPLIVITATGALAADRQRAWFPDGTGVEIYAEATGSAHVTVSAVREFRSVKMGEVVTLDTLSNPATGEKVYDVLRPVAGPSPNPTGTSVTAVPTPPQLSLKGIELRLDGQLMNATVSWIIGAAARIDIPGDGVYVIAASDPKNAHFFQTVRAEGKSLSWSIDGDRLQVISKTDVGASGIIWVYHDPNFRSQEQPDAVRLQTADTVEWLLPTK